MRAPDFWYARGGGAAAALAPAALAPAAWIYGCAAAASARIRAAPQRAPVPVISVGNLTAGGAGKTPVALDITARLAARGAAPAVVMRGYGAKVKGALRVDPARHSAAHTGDEALLHAAAAPVWVAPDRRAGAEAAAAAGCGVIVLDDGHQNRALEKTLSIVVIDGADGFGNGRLLPAGPLREPVRAGLARADAVVILGGDARGCAALAPPGAPVLRAEALPDAAARALCGESCAAFAGIGRPEKVFKTMRAAGLKLVSARAFADHHVYAPAELARMKDAAAAQGARLVTTAKDFVRLPQDARGGVTPFGVRLAWGDEGALDSLLRRAAGGGL